MNKLKGCSKAIKMKYLIFVFVTAVLVSLPTRVYQLLALVNTETGFYDNGDITVPVLYGVLALFSVLFLVLSFLSKEVPSPKLPTGKNPVLGIGSAVMAFGMLWDILATLRAIVPTYDSESESFFAILRNNMQSNGGFVPLLKIVFAFFAIFWFLIFAISHLNGKAAYKEYKVLALSPVCWGVATLIGKLMNAVSFITVSELLFEIFAVVFVTVFFLTFARISTGVFTEDVMWNIYGCGFGAALFSAIVTIPRLVCMLVSVPAVEGHNFSFTYLGIFIFAIAYILASLGIGFKDGFKNMRTVSAIDLPDDDEIVIKSRNSTGEMLTSFEEFSEDYEAPQEEPEYELVDTTESYSEEVEEPVIDEKAINEEVEEFFETFEAPEVEEPAMEEPVIDEKAANEEVEEFLETFEAPEVEEPAMEEPVIDEKAINEEVEEPVAEEPVAEEPVAEEPVAEEPVVDEKAEAFEDIFKGNDDFDGDIIPAEIPDENSFEINIFEDIAEEQDGVLEIFEEEEDSVVENAPVKEVKKEKKAKKEKQGLFSRKKAAPEVDEIPEDLKPISWADLKNKE